MLKLPSIWGISDNMTIRRRRRAMPRAGFPSMVSRQGTRATRCFESSCRRNWRDSARIPSSGAAQAKSADGAIKMNVRRLAGRTANRLLRRIGLELSPVAIDFESRFLSEKRLDRMFADIAGIASANFASQSILRVRQKFDLQAETGRFYEAYLKTPFRRKYGGSRIGKLLWQDVIAKSLA